MRAEREKEGERERIEERRYNDPGIFLFLRLCSTKKSSSNCNFNPIYPIFIVQFNAKCSLDREKILIATISPRVKFIRFTNDNIDSFFFRSKQRAEEDLENLSTAVNEEKSKKRKKKEKEKVRKLYHPISSSREGEQLPLTLKRKRY